VTEVMTFDRLLGGAELGQMRDRIDGEFIGLWQDLYPGRQPVGDVAPAGMAAALIMRAYLRVVSPRPQGNIHAGMEMRILEMPRIGEWFETHVRCIAKEARGQRNFVEFGTSTLGDGARRLFDGRLRLIWAA
jgi:hypothetical protein